MAKPEPALLALNKWLNTSLIVPLLPLLVIFILRLLAGDPIDVMILWCDEVITFSLQMAVTIIMQCDLLRKNRNIARSAIVAATWFRSVGIFCGAAMVLALYMVSRDGTVSDRLSEATRWRSLCGMLGITAVLFVVQVRFSIWIRGIKR